jgi:hypothetical protein
MPLGEEGCPHYRVVELPFVSSALYLEDDTFQKFSSAHDFSSSRRAVVCGFFVWSSFWFCILLGSEHVRDGDCGTHFGAPLHWVWGVDLGLLFSPPFDSSIDERINPMFGIIGIVRHERVASPWSGSHGSFGSQGILLSRGKGGVRVVEEADSTTA